MFQSKNLQNTETELKCRLCGSSTKKFISQDDTQFTCRILTETFKIEVEPDTNILKICRSCFNECKRTYEFYNKIKQGLETLKACYYDFARVDVKVDTDELFPIQVKVEPVPEENSPAVNTNLMEDDDAKDDKSPIGFDDNDDDFQEQPKTCLDTELEAKPPNKVTPENEPPLTDIETRVARLKGALNLSRYEKRRILYEFMCFKCFAKFDEESELKEHLSSTHDIGNLMYLCCDKIIRRSVIDEHIRFHMCSKKFVCPACGKAFMKMFGLKVHAKQNCKKKVSCPICDKPGLTAYDYQDHINTHGPSSIENNSQDKTDPILEAYICDICNRKSKSKKCLKSHMRNYHLQKEPLMCDQCAFTSPSKSILKNHIDSMHSNKTPERCPHCDKAVKGLRQHILIHHDNSCPSVCSECGVSFGNRRLLAVHMTKKHDHRRPWVCNVCGKSYKLKCQLSEHSYSHTGTYKYSCEFCSFQVNYMRNMRAHWKTAHLEYYKDVVKKRLQRLYGPSGKPKSMESNKGIAAIKLLDL